MMRRLHKLTMKISHASNLIFMPAQAEHGFQFRHLRRLVIITSNRMYNYQKFNQYFAGAVSDSTYVYDMDNTNLVWSNNTSYTHPAAGTYDVTYYTLGGFWTSCADFTSTSVVINPLPATPTITPGGPTTFCAGGSVTLTSSAASGNQWSTGEITPSVVVSSSN